MNIDKSILNKIKITPLLDTLKLENISDEEYFSEKYNGFISNSRLGILKRSGVKAFFEGIKNEYNPSFQFGSNLHALYLQPESFELIESVFKPTAKAGLMADALYKNDGTIPTDDEIKSMSYIIGYYKDKLTPNRLKEFKDKAEPYWRDRFVYEQNNPIQEKTRIYTDEKSIGLINCCLESINNNKEFNKLIHPEGITEDPYSNNEQTILLDIKAEIPEYESKIFRLKAKLDNFTIDKEENIITINDLKTTSKLANEFDPTFFSYQREIASYSWLLKLCSEKFFDLNSPIINGNFLVVSTIPNFNSLVYPMTKKLFDTGWKEYIYLLKTIIYYSIVEGYEI